jgi:hypothetical protein
MANDTTIRHHSATAPREIKASAHYAYIQNGITLDGSKFAAGELVLEGQCLVKDDVSGKYEKYADGAASQAVIEGAANITPADTTLHANTKLTITVNGVGYDMAYAALDALAAGTTEAQIITAVKAAVNAKGVTLDKVANVAAVGNKLRITTIEAGSGQSVSINGTFGDGTDEAELEALFGIAMPSSDVGTGNFPEGKSNPVILDESVKFVVKDDGANPDVTVGQVLVHGAVYNGMLVGATAAFKAAFGGGMRFVQG